MEVNSAEFRPVCLDMLLICPFKETVLCKWVDWNLWREIELILFIYLYYIWLLGQMNREAFIFTNF